MAAVSNTEAYTGAVANYDLSSIILDSKMVEASLATMVQSAKTNFDWLNTFRFEEPGHKWHRDSSTDKDSLLDTCSPDSALKDRDCGLAAVQPSGELMAYSDGAYQVWHGVFRTDLNEASRQSAGMRKIAPKDIGVFIAFKKYYDQQGSGWLLRVKIKPELVHAAIQPKEQ